MKSPLPSSPRGGEERATGEEIVKVKKTYA